MRCPSIFKSMGLNYRTLQYKPSSRRALNDGTTEMVKDLLAKTWSEWNGSEFINPIMVNKYYVARPDLISLAVYGTDEYGDMICKFNGVSNPFELNEGMILQIPPLAWLQEGCRYRERVACDLLQDSESIQPKKDTKAKRDSARSSSTSTVGDAPAFVIDRTLGLVLY